MKTKPIVGMSGWPPQFPPQPEPTTAQKTVTIEAPPGYVCILHRDQMTANMIISFQPEHVQMAAQPAPPASLFNAFNAFAAPAQRTWK